MNRFESASESWIALAGRPCRPVARLTIRLGLILGLAALTMVVTSSSSIAQPGGVLTNVGFDQNLNAQIPLTLPFKDGNDGRDVRLADYFGKKPVMLVMGYKNCPLLCSTVLAELTRSLKPLDFSVGKEFDLVYVSIDPKESSEVAEGQKRVYLKRYNRPGSESGWHALTGTKESIATLARSIGFRFSYNPRTGAYAHTAGFVLLTSTGKVSQYFYGVEFPNKDLKAALITASANRIGTPIDKVVMYCYDYDPTTGKHSLAIMRIIRVLGIATALALGSYLFAMVRRDRRKARVTGSAFTELPPGPAIP